MADRNKILDDSSLKLAVSMDDTSKQTQDMGAAFELNAGAALDLSVEQEKLGQSMVKASKAKNTHTKQVEKSTDTSKEEERAQKEHAEALRKRAEVEEKLSKQQPIVRYDEQPNAPGATPDATKELPEAVKSLKTLMKEELGTRRTFLKEYKSEKDQQHKDRMKRLKQYSKMFSPIENMKNSKTSGTARVVGSTLSAGKNLIGSSIDGLLSQIVPGYSAIKEGTKFVAKSYVDASKGRREKRWEKQANKDYTSRMKRLKDDRDSGTVKSGEYGSKILPSVVKADAKKAKEEKAKLKENQKTDRDREESSKDRKGILDILGGIKKALIFKAIFGMLGGLVGSIGGLIMTGFGILAATVSGLGGAIAGMGATLATKLGSAFKTGLESLKSLFDKINPFKDKSTKTTPKQADKKDPKKGTSSSKEPVRKTEPPKSSPAPKSAPKTTRTGGMKKISGILSRGAARIAPWALRAIPGLGLAVTALTLGYEGAKAGMLGEEAQSFAQGISNDIDKVVEYFTGEKPESEQSDSVGANELQPGTNPASAETKELDAEIAHRSKQEQELRLQREIQARASYGGHSSNNVVQTSNNVTNVHAGGYGGFQPDYGPHREGAMIR